MNIVIQQQLADLAAADASFTVDIAALQAEDIVLAAAIAAAAAGTLVISSTTPADVGTAAVGVGATVARADHVHGHGNLAGGSFHAVAISGGAAGFFTGTDKAKLDAMAAGATAEVDADATHAGRVTLGAQTLGTGRKTADSLTGTADVTSAAFISSTANVASAGAVRLARADLIDWRNNANGANITLGVSASDRLQFQSVDVVTISSSDTLTNKTLTSPTINSGALSGTFSGAHTYSGAITSTVASGSNAIILASGARMHFGDATRYISDDATNLLFTANTRITGKFGVGLAPSTQVDILNTQNATTRVQVKNASASGSAVADFYATNGTGGTVFQVTGTGYTTSGAGDLPAMCLVRADNTLTNGIFITTAGTNPLKLGTNDVVRLTFDGSTGATTFTAAATFNTSIACSTFTSAATFNSTVVVTGQASAGGFLTTASQYQWWKNSTPTSAGAIGPRVPGSTDTDDIILSTWLAAGSWTERMRIANSTGNITFSSATVTAGGVAVLTQTNTVTGITNKTFTSPVINTGILSASGTALTLQSTVANTNLITGVIIDNTVALTGFAGAQTFLSVRTGGVEKFYFTSNAFSSTGTGYALGAASLPWNVVYASQIYHGSSAGSLDYYGNINNNNSSTANKFTNQITLTVAESAIAGFYPDGVASTRALYINKDGGLGTPTVVPLGGADVSGGATVKPLTTPTGLTVVRSGSGGVLTAATYYYRVSAINATGESLACAEVSAVAASGTTNSMVITWARQLGATGYKIYGRTTGTELLIATGNQTDGTYTDTGSITPSGALPAANSSARLRTLNNAGSETFSVAAETGNIRTAGNLGVGNSAAGAALGTVVKKLEVFDASGSSLGYLPIYDAIT